MFSKMRRLLADFLGNSFMQDTFNIENMQSLYSSPWRLLSVILSALGLIFVVSGTAAYYASYQQYVAVLVVFGGIFLVFGLGLLVITHFEK